jgi:hypothetical protein
VEEAPPNPAFENELGKAGAFGKGSARFLPFDWLLQKATTTGSQTKGTLNKALLCSFELVTNRATMAKHEAGVLCEQRLCCHQCSQREGF